MTRRAVFLDRDGTLVHARHYPSRTEELILYDGIGEPIRRLQYAGFRLIVVTNQSGIARGLFTEDDLATMHADLAARLSAEDVHVDGFFYCPHHPDGIVTEFARACDCRKPAPGMIVRAAREFDIDTRGSWMVGDILADIEAGNRAGCRTVLVDLDTESLPTTPDETPEHVARNSVDALTLIAEIEGLRPRATTPYWPQRWDVKSPVSGEVHAIRK